MRKRISRFLSGSSTKDVVRRLENEDYSGGGNVDRMLFICGLHRSGTTMVEHYLRAVAEVACLRASAPENEGQHLQDVYPAAIDCGGPGRFAFEPAMNPDPPDTGEADVLRRRLLDCWAPFVVGEEQVLCEKSPPNLTKIRWLRRIFPGAQFLIVVRDPRASAAATMKWAKSSSYEELIFHWGVAHSLAIRDLDDDCHTLRYEDFCEAPKSALEKSGILDAIPRRSAEFPVEERFQKVSNSNGEYISAMPARRFGDGAWNHFGYDI